MFKTRYVRDQGYDNIKVGFNDFIFVYFFYVRVIERGEIIYVQVS